MDTYPKEKLNILLIGFNRSDLIEKSLIRLSQLSHINIWISIDGPRINNDKDLKENKKIKTICKKFKIKSGNLRFSKENFGCRKGVIESITWFFSNVKSGFILEDDIEIHPEFLNIISYYLEKYYFNKNIASISSHNSQKIIKKYGPTSDSFIMPTCRVWGWATWRDRWDEFLNLERKLKNKNLLKIFYFFPKEYRTFDSSLIIWNCINGYFDTWDYEWNLYHIKTNKGSITPNGIFCLNHGFRKDAMHTKEKNSIPWKKMEYVKINNELFKNVKIPDQNIKYEISSECGFLNVKSRRIEYLKFLKYFIKKSFS